MFQEVINKAASDYSKDDKARITIAHEDLPDEIFIHLQDLSNLTGETVMNRFEKVLNSHQNMSVNDSFKISVGLMRTKRGGGRVKPLLPHLNNTVFSSIINKTSIVEIVGSEDENEKICAAMSIVVCMAKLDGMKRSEYKNLIDKQRQGRFGQRSLRSRAKNLQQSTGLRTDKPLAVRELSEFEKILKVKICVVEFVDNNEKPVLTQCSNMKSDKVIFLYFSDGHYHAIVNPKAFLMNKKMCTKCFQIVPFKSHICLEKKEEKTCYVCNRQNCPKGTNIKCKDCNMICRGKSCFEAHKLSKKGKNGEDELSLCEKRHKCVKCNKVITLSKQNISDHICGQYHCDTCDKWVFDDHMCYLRRKKIKISSGKFLFFDFETRQDSVFQCDKGYQPKGRIENCQMCTHDFTCASCRKCKNCNKSNCGRNFHQPNLAVCQSACDECKLEKVVQGSKCVYCGNICAQCFKFREAGSVDKVMQCRFEKCCEREVVFKGDDTLDDFCTWLISPIHKNTTVLAHNSKAFDSCFILNYCISEARIRPEVIFTGSKIMSLKIADDLNIRFIDSLNFMGMALKKLPAAFGLQNESEFDTANIGELSKGDFPHRMNTKENENYVGPWPSPELYGVDNMKQADRDKFLIWHKQQECKIFDLQKELEDYCKVDVTILRLACIKFRDLILEVTKITDTDGEILGQVDPFAHITIASTCMQVFRVNFIEEYYNVVLADGRGGVATYKSGMWNLDGDKISPEDILEKEYVYSNLAQIPSQGYVRNSRHSAKSIAWLEWEAQKYNINIQHARNIGEKMIKSGAKKYFVDGWFEGDISQDKEQNFKGTVFEFNGCRYHGCMCISDRGTRDNRTKFSMDDLNQMTLKKKKDLEALELNVISIYECEFDAMVKEDPELKLFIQNLDVPKRMKIRDSFFGGRTSPFKLHYKCKDNEEGLYYDFCSLYPFITKSAKYPLGHPEILTHNFDYSMEHYFGIAHVKILPPDDLYLPVLPVRIRGKLMFPLCMTCAITQNNDVCTHSTDQRCLTGVWCTPEIKLAISNGYKVIKIYEIYNYKQSTQFNPETKTGGLFSDQVDLFVKLKTQASGYPSNVITESEKDAYISEVYEKSGIQLDKNKIEVNPALRSISKICCNSFWGKLAERENKPKSKYISSTEELSSIMNNSTLEITNFHIVNEDMMVIEYVNVETFEKESLTTNIMIASFTTCWARIELWKEMKSVDKSLLYCDTDSIIFIAKKNDDGTYEKSLKVGTCLGELTNEMKPGQFISEFVCTGPKSYSYRANDGEESVKFKGIAMTFKNSGRVNFESVKELVFGTTEYISLAPQNQFKRIKYDGVIYNSDMVKRVKATFDKRRILDDFNTLPYGYR
jgi:hypothetical protein